MANFQMTLDDNSFDVVPAGSYHFRVTALEEGFYSGKSDKIPNGTQQMIVHFDIPYTTENGEYKVASLKKTFNLCKIAMFAVRQFAECIGLCGESGRLAVDFNNSIGKDGICEITVRTGNNGNEFSGVENCYPPSKAPKACVNDKEWDSYTKGMTPVVSGDDPF